MPVPTLITDLDTVAANNDPIGSESVGNNVDNYLRAFAAFIAQVYAGEIGISDGIVKATSGTMAPAVAGTDYLAPAAIGVTVQAYDADIPTAIISQADAEAGIATDSKAWTAQRVAQAITAQTNQLTLMTAQASTSGTSIDFTSIPSWVKRITIMFDGVSTNGTSFPMIRIGDSGGVETSGYSGCTQRGTNFTAHSGGWSIDNGSSAAYALHGAVVLSLLNASTNTWTILGNVGLTGITFTANVGGTKSLSATLDRVQLTTVSGTDAFDAGTINVMYE